MKKILTFGAAVMATVAFATAHMAVNPVASSSSVNVAPSQADAVKWTKVSHNFGTVPEGPAAEVVFKFTNNGTTPIAIKTAQPSCGCTTPTFTKTPVMPGESGEVKASFGTQGRPGYFNKTVTVTLDNGATQVLTIEGTVATDTGTPKSGEIK
jgi:Protein of unknown function (DUF1573)